jgi:divalent metal cation (Fe/Co/Zn/Cd) transporter
VFIHLTTVSSVLHFSSRCCVSPPGNSNKILSLSGYSSGLMLIIFAIVIMVEAVKRFYNPVDIVYREAIMVV